MRMAQSSYKKVCAKHPGRTLPHDPFAKKSDSTAADHSEVRAALADSITRTFDSDGVVGGFVAGVCTDQVEDTFPETNTIDTPAIASRPTTSGTSERKSSPAEGSSHRVPELCRR